MEKVPARLVEISIHALRGEGDGSDPEKSEGRKDFYPRPPWGGRRYHGVQQADGQGISIHALRGEGDHRGHDPPCLEQISIHALRGEGDYVGWIYNQVTGDFYPRPPWGGRHGGSLL